MLARDGNASDRFFVIENDLTRCIGLGDLTVVPHGRRWSRPLSLEIKTSGVFKDGGFANVEVFAVVVEETDQARMMVEFRDVLGLNPGGPSKPLEESHPKQAARLLSRGKYLHRLAGTYIKRVQDPDESRWDVMSRVISRAMTEGLAFEIPEDGVARVAIRRKERDGAADAEVIRSALTPHGFAEECESASSIDFQLDHDVSAMIAPIALWQLPIDHRIALLLADIEFATVLHPSVWGRAMQRVELDFEIDDGNWLIGRGETKIIVPRLAAERIRLGVFFEGISPQSTATTIRTAIDRLEQGDSDVVE
jgi:hypothetical protein